MQHVNFTLTLSNYFFSEIRFKYNIHMIEKTDFDTGFFFKKKGAKQDSIPSR